MRYAISNGAEANLILFVFYSKQSETNGLSLRSGVTIKCHLKLIIPLLISNKTTELIGKSTGICLGNIDNKQTHPHRPNFHSEISIYCSYRSLNPFISYIMSIILLRGGKKQQKT